MRLLPIVAAAVVIGPGAFACSGDPPIAPPEPSPRPGWLAVDTLVTTTTLALAVDPAGEWILVVEGDGAGTGYRLFDPATGDPLGPPHPLGGVSDVAITRDGALGAVVGAGLPGTSLLSIDTDGEVERVAVAGRIVERHPTRDVFYVAGEAGVSRVDRDGFVVSAEEPAVGPVRALGISGDGSLVYAFTGRGVVALDAETMEVVAHLDSPMEVQVFVPLDRSSNVLAIGTPADRPFRGPIWVTKVDPGSGRLGTVRSVADGIRRVDFSATSPWARIDDATILVPSSYGVIAVDPGSGAARMLATTAFEGVDPCCAIAWGGTRLFVTEARPFQEANGPVVVYERDR